MSQQRSEGSTAFSWPWWKARPADPPGSATSSNHPLLTSYDATEATERAGPASNESVSSNVNWPFRDNEDVQLPFELPYARWTPNFVQASSQTDHNNAIMREVDPDSGTLEQLADPTGRSYKVDPFCKAAKTTRTLHGRRPSQPDRPQQAFIQSQNGPPMSSAAASYASSPAFQPELLQTVQHQASLAVPPGQADQNPCSAGSAAKPQPRQNWPANVGFSCTKAPGNCNTKAMHHIRDLCNPSSPFSPVRPSASLQSSSAESSSKSSRGNLTPQDLQHLGLDYQQEIVQKFNEVFSSMSISCHTEPKAGDGNMSCSSLDTANYMQSQRQAQDGAFSSYKQMQQPALQDVQTAGLGRLPLHQEVRSPAKLFALEQELVVRQEGRMQQAKLQYQCSQQQDTQHQLLSQAKPVQPRPCDFPLHCSRKAHPAGTIISPADEPVLPVPGPRPCNPLIQPPHSHHFRVDTAPPDTLTGMEHAPDTGTAIAKQRAARSLYGEFSTYARSFEPSDFTSEQAKLWQPSGVPEQPGQGNSNTTNFHLRAQQHPAAVCHTAAPTVSRRQSSSGSAEDAKQSSKEKCVTSISAGRVEQQTRQYRQAELAASEASMHPGWVASAEQHVYNRANFWRPYAELSAVAGSTKSSNCSSGTGIGSLSDQSASWSYQPREGPTGDAITKSFAHTEVGGCSNAALTSHSIQPDEVQRAVRPVLGFSPGIFELLPNAVASAAALASGIQLEGATSDTARQPWGPQQSKQVSYQNELQQQQSSARGHQKSAYPQYAPPQCFTAKDITNSTVAAGWRQARPAAEQQLFNSSTATIPSSQPLHHLQQPSGLTKLKYKGRQLAGVASTHDKGLMQVSGRGQAAAVYAKLAAAGGGAIPSHVPPCSASWRPTGSIVEESQVSSAMAAAASMGGLRALAPIEEGCSSNSRGCSGESQRLAGRASAAVTAAPGTWLTQFESDGHFWKKELLQGLPHQAADSAGQEGSETQVLFPADCNWIPVDDFCSPWSRPDVCMGSFAAATVDRQFKISAGVQARLARLYGWAGAVGSEEECSGAGGVSGALNASAVAAVDGRSSSRLETAAGSSSNGSVCGEPAVLSEGEEDNTADSKEQDSRQPLRLELTPPFADDPKTSVLEWKWELYHHRQALQAKRKQTQAKRRLHLSSFAKDMPA